MKETNLETLRQWQDWTKNRCRDCWEHRDIPAAQCPQWRYTFHGRKLCQDCYHKHVAELSTTHRGMLGDVPRLLAK